MSAKPKTAQKSDVPERGRLYPGVKGKIVDWIEYQFEEEMLYIHIRFVDQTEVAFTLGSRLKIIEADLTDWKTGDGVIKRTYVQSPEIKAIVAQDAEFQRICRRLDKEKRNAGRKYT